MLSRSLSRAAVVGSCALIASNARLLSSCSAGGSAKVSASCVPPRPSSLHEIDLKNKVVLITGATAGIGAACAWKFAGILIYFWLCLYHCY